MSIKVRLKHSSTLNKEPLPADLDSGELALNINENSPAAYIKDSAGNIVKLAGPGDGTGVSGYWNRTGTDVSPATNGDSLQLKDGTGTVSVDLDAGTSASPLVRDATGKIGIGVAAPAVNLHVDGGTNNAPVIVEASQTNRSRLVFRNNIETGTECTIELIDEDLRFNTNSGERVRIDKDGDVKIGGTLPASPNIQLKVDGTASFESGSVTLGAVAGVVGTGGITCTSMIASQAVGADPIFLGRQGSTDNIRMNGDGSATFAGRLLVGTQTARNLASIGTSKFVVEGTGYNSSSVAFVNNENNQQPPYLILGKSRGGSVGSSTAVQNGDSIGQIVFAGADGTDLDSRAAEVVCLVDGTPGADSMPGRLVFSTTPSGSASPVERAQFDSAGNFLFGGTLPSAPNISLNPVGKIYSGRANGEAMDLNRDSSVGATLRILYEDAEKGWLGTNSVNGLMLQSTGTLQCQSGGVGGVQLTGSATSWSPLTSESRLKDFQSDPDVDQCWDLLRDIQLKRYYYKDQEDKTGVSYMGPMADWLGVQDPELLIDTGRSDDDGPIHTYNQGLLDMKALAALSAALKRIEQLEAKVTALEGGAPIIAGDDQAPFAKGSVKRRR